MTNYILWSYRMLTLDTNGYTPLRGDNKIFVHNLIALMTSNVGWVGTKISQ